ncbi:MAG TPA: bifunctional nuclease family protein [Candidatus Obscuribacterales bacterium]
MFVSEVGLDARTGQPIVLLKDEAGVRALPIWIGVAQANAILRALENVKPPRPMTHDLLLNVVEELGYEVERVEVNELTSGTFFATITLTLTDPKTKLEVKKPIDSRPSDAIALALRAKAPIFVAEAVMKEASITVETEKEQAEDEEFKHFLEGLKASDFKIEGIRPDPDEPSDPEEERSNG